MAGGNGTPALPQAYGTSRSRNQAPPYVSTGGRETYPALHALHLERGDWHGGYRRTEMHIRPRPVRYSHLPEAQPAAHPEQRHLGARLQSSGPRPPLRVGLPRLAGKRVRRQLSVLSALSGHRRGVHAYPDYRRTQRRTLARLTFVIRRDLPEGDVGVWKGQSDNGMYSDKPSLGVTRGWDNLTD